MKAGFNTEAWIELCLDIDEQVSPDIVGTMTNMSAVADTSVDAIFSSHNIEHLYPHEVPLALKDFPKVAIKRRLRPSYDLWSIATKVKMDDAALRALTGELDSSIENSVR